MAIIQIRTLLSGSMKTGITNGYRPTQPVDMSKLKIPKNLGTAAVMPRNSGNSVRTSVEPKKE